MNKQLLIDKALQNGISEIEIYQEKKSGTSIALFNGQVDKFTISDVNAISIRALVNGKMIYFSTEYLDDSQIDFVIKSLKENSEILDTSEKETLHDGSGDYQEIQEPSYDFEELDSKYKIELVKKIEKAFLNYDKRIVSVSNLQYSENIEECSITNSNGLNLSKKKSYALVYAVAVGKEDNDIKTNGDGIAIKNLKDFNSDDFVKKVSDKLLKSLGAKTIVSGSYPVILSKKAASNLLQAFAPIFSGSNALKNTTKLKDKIGTKIFGENITIIDDPFDTRSLSQDNFDDEGIACYKKAVVENGVMKTLLHNSKTGAFFNLKSTGNGFKINLSSLVEVRNSNLYLEKGDTSLDEMIASIEDGLLIDTLVGLHAGVNEISGDFNLQSSGFKIENGKIAYPVTLLVISGNIYSLYNDVELIGNEIDYGLTSVTSPDIKIKSMKVSSK